MRLLPLDDSIKEIEIYVLISQISNEFYVWKAKSPNSYQAYKDHAGKKFKQTKDLFERAEKEKKFPQMYLLETIATTSETAYRHCIAWTKYFVEHGMQPLAAERILKHADDLLPETKEIYDVFKNNSLEDVLSDDCLIVSDFKKNSTARKRTPKDEIKITVSHKEYELIRERAEKSGLSMSRYCKNMVLEGKINYLESPPPWEYIAEIRGAKIILRQILYAIYKTGKYFPADMENIEKMSEIICEEERKFTQAYSENTKLLMKLLPK